MAKFAKGKSGNPKGRPPGRTDALMEALIEKFGCEKNYWIHVCTKALDGDGSALTILSNRIRSPLKARSAPVMLNIEGTTAVDFTSGVLTAVSQGQLPPDEASSLLTAILAGDKIEKLEVLERKINQLLEVSHVNR